MKTKFNPVLARKHLMRAMEIGIGLELGQQDVYRPTGAKYEIRSTRKTKGVELMWAPVGTFYNPDLSQFKEVK